MSKKNDLNELKSTGKSVTDLSLYRLLCIVLKDMAETVISMLKDVKVTFGYALLEDISEMLRRIITSYTRKDVAEKYIEARALYELYEHVSCIYLMLYENGNISLRQLHRFIINMGDFGDKANRWVSSLESRMNKPMVQD